MNKTESHIRQHGESIGFGSDRDAYLFEGKVFKFAMGQEAAQQTLFEQKIWESIPSKFKVFFPNPSWMGRIVTMDYVEVASQTINTTKVVTKLPFNEFTKTIPSLPYNGGDIVWVAYQTGIKINWELLQEFFDWFVKQGGMVIDIINNDDNFGIQNGELKIVDWGWSNINTDIINFGDR